MEFISGAPVSEAGERERQRWRRQEKLWEQLRWHAAQARRHRTISALIIRHHEQEAARLERALGIDHDEGDAA